MTLPVYPANLKPVIATAIRRGGEAGSKGGWGFKPVALLVFSYCACKYTILQKQQ